MVPFSTFKLQHGGFMVRHWNAMAQDAVVELLGEAAPGRSTGEAMSLMENWLHSAKQWL